MRSLLLALYHLTGANISIPTKTRDAMTYKLVELRIALSRLLCDAGVDTLHMNAHERDRILPDHYLKG